MSPTDRPTIMWFRRDLRLADLCFSGVQRRQVGQA